MGVSVVLLAYVSKGLNLLGLIQNVQWKKPVALCPHPGLSGVIKLSLSLSMYVNRHDILLNIPTYRVRESMRLISLYFHLVLVDDVLGVENDEVCGQILAATTLSNENGKNWFQEIPSFSEGARL